MFHITYIQISCRKCPNIFVNQCIFTIIEFSCVARGRFFASLSFSLARKRERKSEREGIPTSSRVYRPEENQRVEEGQRRGTTLERKFRPITVPIIRTRCRHTICRICTRYNWLQETRHLLLKRSMVSNSFRTHLKQLLLLHWYVEVAKRRTTSSW